MKAYYNVLELSDIEQVKDIFNDKVDYTMNWLFLSTSGVHGSFVSLDDIEAAWDESEDSPKYYGHDVTVLVCHPRMVCMKYGNLDITREDIPWLREVVAKTLVGVAVSQECNLPPETLSNKDSSGNVSDPMSLNPNKGLAKE